MVTFALAFQNFIAVLCAFILQNLRLQKVDGHVNSIHELSVVMLIDFYEIMTEIHPSLVDCSKCKGISNDTLARLAGKVHSLKQEKQQRLQKVI